MKNKAKKTIYGWGDVITVKHKKSIILFLFIAILVNSSFQITAIANKSNAKAVVFVLDSSGSMKENDPNRLAIDSITQLIYSLPSNYQVGIVSFNTKVSFKSEMVSSKDRQSLVNQTKDIMYSGYTSAGSGLEVAINMLDSVSAVEKNIVILSDGEIILKNDSETKKDIALYENEVEKSIAKNIPIHVIGLGNDMEDTTTTIFSGATRTNGSKYHVPKAVDIQKAIDKILLEELNVVKRTLGAIESNGESQNIKVDLPSKNMSNVKILLTSTNTITNLVADFEAENSTQDIGERYAFIDLDYPTKEFVNITIESSNNSKIKVDFIPEYNVNIETSVKYTDTEPQDRQNEFYDRVAEVTFSFVDATNQNKKIFTEDYFDDSSIVATINDEKVELQLENGQAVWRTNVSTDMEVNIKMDYTDLPVNVLGGETDNIELSKAPIYERKNYLPYILGVILVLILVCIAIIRKKRAKIPVLIEFAEPSKYYYTGKFNIYITKTKKDLDFPPLTFNLFRLSSGREVSLEEVLRKLDIEETFEGAEKILFKPSDNRKLILNNQSDCTIIKNREILMKNKSIEIDIESKVDITFEDELSELMLQYKDTSY